MLATKGPGILFGEFDTSVRAAGQKGFEDAVEVDVFLLESSGSRRVLVAGCGFWGQGTNLDRYAKMYNSAPLICFNRRKAPGRLVQRAFHKGDPRL